MGLETVRYLNKIRSLPTGKRGEMKVNRQSSILDASDTHLISPWITFLATLLCLSPHPFPRHFLFPLYFALSSSYFCLLSHKAWDFSGESDSVRVHGENWFPFFFSHFFKSSRESAHLTVMKHIVLAPEKLWIHISSGASSFTAGGIPGCLILRTREKRELFLCFQAVRARMETRDFRAGGCSQWECCKPWIKLMFWAKVSRFSWNVLFVSQFSGFSQSPEQEPWMMSFHRNSREGEEQKLK